MGARRARPAVPVELSGDARETLERWARRPKSSQALALRCRIVLAAAAGRANNEIAAALGCHAATVSKWRCRFAQRRLDGLADDPRPGPPRKTTDAMIEDMLVRTLETTPSDATHWSTRSMANAAGVSQTAVSQIWRAFGLKPHLVEEFKVSPDPQFVDKTCDVVGLYLNPPQAEVVLCADDKTGIQALARTAPVLPLLPGMPQRCSHDYRCCGTTDLFAALDAASGKVITSMSPRYRSEEFRKYLNLIDKEVPDGLDVHIVLDNVSTHKTPAVKRWLICHPRFKAAPRRARCTTAKAGRTIRLHPHHELLRAARVQAAAPEFQHTYRRRRPTAERSIAWLVRRGRRCPCRSTVRNRIWLTTRAAAVNLLRLANLGLAHNSQHWALN